MDNDSEPIESAIPIELGILPDGGAPNPVLVHTERGTLLVFELLAMGASDPKTGVLAFADFRALVDSGSDEESLDRHRLWSHGLSEWQWVYQVQNSAWAASVDTLHVQSQWPDQNRPSRHFVFLFHDSTLEIAAPGFRYAVSPLHRSDLLALLLRSLEEAPTWPELDWSTET